MCKLPSMDIPPLPCIPGSTSGKVHRNLALRVSRPITPSFSVIRTICDNFIVQTLYSKCAELRFSPCLKSSWSDLPKMTLCTAPCAMWEVGKESSLCLGEVSGDTVDKHVICHLCPCPSCPLLQGQVVPGLERCPEPGNRSAGIVSSFGGITAVEFTEAW